MPSMLNPGITRTRFFELTSEEWMLLFAAAMLTVAGIAAISPDVTMWAALGLGFSALVVGSSHRHEMAIKAHRGLDLGEALIEGVEDRHRPLGR